jgi:D-glycero-D-manno-heptose 1,7-bisphosphate phosphatase
MNKAVFIDRDGVINNDEGLYYIYNENDFKLNANISKNIAKLCHAGFLIIVISNQGGIGKGLYTISHTERLHQLLCDQVVEHGGNITEFYFCPHHEQSGRCLCRKPDSLLIEKAMARFKIDTNNACFIGDSPRDIEAAEKANIKGILVPKNTDIAAFVDEIIAKDGSK